MEQKSYFTKQTIGVRLSDEVKKLINENYTYITESETEISGSEFFTKVLEKAIKAKEEISIQNARIQEYETVRHELEQKLNKYEGSKEELELEVANLTLHVKSLQKDSNNKTLQETDILINFESWQFEFLKSHVENLNIQKFYKSFKNKEFIKELEPEQLKKSIQDLLVNHYFVRALRGHTQPQPHTREQAITFIKKLKQKSINEK